MSSKDTAISVRSLSKSYTIAHNNTKHTTLGEAFMHRLKRPLERTRNETFWALRDVSFDVQKGEVVGVIGRNGAGKSTLLKILSQITEPTAGEIHLHGRVGSLLEVGTGFHPELTGRENIFLNGAILGMRRREIERQFDAIVDFAEVEHFLDTPVKRYSSGMYVRLAFAVAAHLDTEILIVDEVLAVGDAGFQKKCMGKMHDVSEQDGRTVLFVSHNIEIVRKLCTRGIVLNKGQIITNGNVKEAIDTYTQSGLSSQSVFDLEPPQDPTVPAFAYRLTVEDNTGTPTAEIPVGRPWQVRIDFKVTKKTNDLVVALGMLTPMDSPFRTTWSPHQNLEPGHYQAIFRDDKIHIEPGRYPLVVGLSIDTRSFHSIENAGTLQIGDITDFEEEVDLVRISNCGTILNPLDVCIKRIS